MFDGMLNERDLPGGGPEQPAAALYKPSRLVLVAVIAAALIAALLPVAIGPNQCPVAPDPSTELPC